MTTVHRKFVLGSSSVCLGRNSVTRQVCLQGGNQGTALTRQRHAGPNSSTDSKSAELTVPESTRPPPKSDAKYLDVEWLKWGCCNCSAEPCHCKRKPQAQVTRQIYLAEGSFGKVSSAVLGEDGPWIAIKEPNKEKHLILGRDFGFYALVLERVSHQNEESI
jgi:hypothetical protein